MYKQILTVYHHNSRNNSSGTEHITLKHVSKKLFQGGANGIKVDLRSQSPHSHSSPGCVPGNIIKGPIVIANGNEDRVQREKNWIH